MAKLAMLRRDQIIAAVQVLGFDPTIVTKVVIEPDAAYITKRSVQDDTENMYPTEVTEKWLIGDDEEKRNATV